MVAIKDLYMTKVTSEDISEFEDRMGIKLPNKYKQLVLKQNGGKPEPNYFEIPEFPGKDSILDFLYGINVTQSYGNLEKKIETFKDRIPSPFIPIGRDPGGNLICVGTKAPYKDKIYYWDHEDELDRKGISKMDMSNMYWIADDIYEFLEKLLPGEE